MTVTQLLGWIQVAQVAISFGLATAEQIKGFIKTTNPNAGDAELNLILVFVLDDATRRKALALQDATGPSTT